MEYSENGISIVVKEKCDIPTKCEVFFNRKMQLRRELELCIIGAILENEATKLKCLDAFAGTGVSGLQWKKHFADRISVTLNDNANKAALAIGQNVKRNNFILRDGTDDQAANELEALKSDASILLQTRQFHFISLDPYGSSVHYLEAAFRQVYNGGLVVVTGTDVAALYGKCPQITLRHYGATTLNTDYVKEMAARILIGAAVRAAGRCGKGVRVLCTLAAEHFVQVALRVERSAAAADRCAEQVRHVLHCRVCAGAAVLNDHWVPIEPLHQKLACSCQAEGQGRTSLLLGPMWTEAIFDGSFCQLLYKQSQLLKLSVAMQTILKLIVSESGEIPRSISQKEDFEPPEKQARIEGRKNIPIFYIDLHKRKLKGVHLPRYDRLVRLLQERGFFASRTHFHTHAIRTSATLAEIAELIRNEAIKKT